MTNANDQLHEFAGTTQWFRHFTGKLYTEGVRHMAEIFQAYWFIDLVMSHQLTPQVHTEEFQTWELRRFDGNQFLAIATDGNKNAFHRGCFTLNTVNDPFQHTHILAKAGPGES